jgi:hypothetical protein
MVLEIGAKEKELRAGAVAGRPAGAVSAAAAGSRTGVLTWRSVGLALLLASAAVDRYTLEVAGVSVRAEQVMVLVVLGALGMTWALDARRGNLTWRQVIRWPLAWLVPYVGVTLLSSMVNAPDVASSLRHTGMIALAAASAVGVYWLADEPGMVRLGVKVLAALGVLEAGYMFVGLAAGQAGFDFATQPGNGEIIVPFGSLWEPNLLGSYLAGAGVLLFAMLFVDGSRRLAWIGASLMFVLCALALSLARAAWVGFFAGAGVVVVLYYARRKMKDERRRSPAIGDASEGAGLSIRIRQGLLVGGLAVVGALAFLPTLAPVLFPGTAWGVLVRVNPAWYDPARDPSVTARVSATKSALDDIAAHPIIGNGAGSYGVTHTGEGGAPGWISNLGLHILYDSGAVGLLAFAAGLGWLGWRGLRRVFARQDSSEEVDLRPQIVGLLGAVTVLLVAFQATEGTWMAFFWGYVGLLAAAVRRP